MLGRLRRRDLRHHTQELLVASMGAFFLETLEFEEALFKGRWRKRRPPRCFSEAATAAARRYNSSGTLTLTFIAYLP
jgi:hypothetical protein